MRQRRTEHVRRPTIDEEEENRTLKQEIAPLLNSALREEDEPAPYASLRESEPKGQESGVVMVPLPM